MTTARFSEDPDATMVQIERSLELIRTAVGGEAGGVVLEIMAALEMIEVDLTEAAALEMIEVDLTEAAAIVMIVVVSTEVTIEVDLTEAAAIVMIVVVSTEVTIEVDLTGGDIATTAVVLTDEAPEGTAGSIRVLRLSNVHVSS